MVGIANKQCTFIYNESERSTTLEPNEEDPNIFKVKVNGELVEEPVKLEHGDRILIGSHYFYLYVDPKIDINVQVVKAEFAGNGGNSKSAIW